MNKDRIIEIRKLVLRCWKDAKIDSLPVDIESISRIYGMPVTSFAKAKECGVSLDGDMGYTICKQIGDLKIFVIVVNDRMSYPQQRITIAHEVGHILLGHFGSKTLIAEKEANFFFAEEILIPIHWSLSMLIIFAMDSV